MWKKIIANPSDPRYVFTLNEIQQQMDCWQETARLILGDKHIKSFVSEAIKDKNQSILLSGAGSSEFVGLSVVDFVRNNLDRYTICAPTTDLVTSPQKYLHPYPPALMVSFARSGNSPESIASVELMEKVSPKTKHLIITCNPKGKLANIKNPNTYVVLLPEKTDDRSLVMTSSFSSMMLAAMLVASGESVLADLQTACKISDNVLSVYPEKIAKYIETFAVERVQFLGTDDNRGLLTEGHLKMLEMNNGLIPTRVDSYLGLRHGPQVFVDKKTLVVAVLSDDTYIRQYESDLLTELKSKQQGGAYIVIGKDAAQLPLPNLLAIETEALGSFIKFPAVIVVQLLGMLSSIYHGLSPDSPSVSGTINRVVKGVNIYPY